MRMLSSFAALAVALAVSAPAWGARYPQYFPRVTEIAAHVAGRPVDIYCEVQEDWDVDPVQAVAPAPATR